MRYPVGHVTGPATFAVFAMVESADESEVLEVGSAAVGPRDNVVGFAPVRWPVAARERTSAVAGGQGAALPDAGGAAGQPVTEDSTGVAEDDGDDVNLGGDPQRPVAR